MLQYVFLCFWVAPTFISTFWVYRILRYVSVETCRRCVEQRYKKGGKEFESWFEGS